MGKHVVSANYIRSRMTYYHSINVTDPVTWTAPCSKTHSTFKAKTRNSPRIAHTKLRLAKVDHTLANF